MSFVSFLPLIRCSYLFLLFLDPNFVLIFLLCFFSTPVYIRSCPLFRSSYLHQIFAFRFCCIKKRFCFSFFLVHICIGICFFQVKFCNLFPFLFFISVAHFAIHVTHTFCHSFYSCPSFFIRFAVFSIINLPDLASRCNHTVTEIGPFFLSLSLSFVSFRLLRDNSLSIITALVMSSSQMKLSFNDIINWRTFTILLGLLRSFHL